MLHTQQLLVLVFKCLYHVTAGFSSRLLLRLSETHLKMAVGACIQLDASNEMKLITAMKQTTATVSTGILERQKLSSW